MQGGARGGVSVELVLLAHRQLQLAGRVVTLARPQAEAVFARALVGRHRCVGCSHGVLGARASRRVARLVFRVRVKVSRH